MEKYMDKIRSPKESSAARREERSGLRPVRRAHALGMPLVVFLTLLAGWFGSSRATAQITLRLQQTPYAEALAEIERQATVTFSYESSLLDGLPPLTVSLENRSLADCLARLFDPVGVAWQVTGSMVVLKKKPRQRIVRGFIRDADTFEALVGASVYDPDTRQGLPSNSEGYFDLSVSPGPHTLYFSYIGYRSHPVSLSASERDTVLDIRLVSNASLQEIVITPSGMDDEAVRSLAMGTIRVNRQVLRELPVLLGEADLVKTLQLTPGVASGTEGMSSLFVRGGSADENLFLLDGNPVYSVGHLGGIFSAFNPESVQEMSFYKAGFPARYGGRLSSIVDVSTREGNLREYHGNASIGLISGTVSLEGPIVKDRTSFHFSLRRSWLDVLAAPAFALYNRIRKKYGESLRVGYAFHDLNLKLTHYFTPRNKVYLTVYNGLDRLKVVQRRFPEKGEEEVFENKSDISFRWGNLQVAGGWKRIYNDRWSGEIAAFFTRYRSKFGRSERTSNGKEGEEDYLLEEKVAVDRQGIRDISLRPVFDYRASSNHRLRFGAEYFARSVSPAVGSPAVWGHEGALFAEDDWTVFPSLRVRGGVRLGLFAGEGTVYTSVEPRLSLRWMMSRRLSFKTSYSRMSQGIQRINNTFLDLPTDAWIPATDRLKPRLSDQYSAGVYYALRPGWELSMEGYYKRMQHLLEYKDDYFLLSPSAPWEEKLTAGSGRGYGVEWLLRKTTGRLTGWAGYTLSWADRRFDALNGGRRFPSRYDNRHKLNIVGMYKLSDRVELSAAWTYSSGNHITLSVENYEDLPRPSKPIGSWEYFVHNGIDLYESRNNYQLPAYHHLDLSLRIYRPKKNGRMGIWQVSLYNAYCRMNPFMVQKNWKWIKDKENPGRERCIPAFKHVGLLPAVPSVTYTYQF